MGLCSSCVSCQFGQGPPRGLGILRETLLHRKLLKAGKMPRNQQLKAGFARDCYSDFSYLWHCVSRREVSLAWIPQNCAVPADLKRERNKLHFSLGCGVGCWVVVCIPNWVPPGKGIAYVVYVLSGLHLVFSPCLRANASEYFQTKMCFLPSFQ